MTVIVGIEHKRKIYMGGDTAASTPDHIDVMDRSKLIKRPGILLGYCGSFRIGQILEYHMDFSDMKRTKEEWLYRDFIEQLRAVTKEQGARDGDSMVDGADLLVGFNKRLYIIQSCFSVLRSRKGYAVVGDPSIAYGSLFSTKKLEPKERLKIALEASAEFIPRCAAPFYYEEI